MKHYLRVILFSMGYSPPPVVVPVSGALLLENGSYLLLEDGNKLLLE